MSDSNRWAIFIDIEGFSCFKSESDFNRSVETILCDLYLIGSKIYRESPERLFAHQMGGDGFVIVSEFAEKDLSHPISIAIILLRSLVLHGFIGKAGISVGNFANVSGCWSSFYKLVEEDLPKRKVLGDWYPIEYDHSRIDLGYGILTTIPVMGFALINSYKAQTKGPKGPNLIIDGSLKEMIPDKFPIVSEIAEHILIDWLRAEHDEINKIATGIGYNKLLDVELVTKNFLKYLENKTDGVSDEWSENANILKEFIND